jgi:membrane-associated protease RseP (regulator of RpoE activity)
MAVNPQIKKIIFRPPKTSNLPIAPMEYAQQYQDQLNNVLRLYFNQIDNFAQGILIPASGTTSGRPIEKLQVGQYYFDTTLGTPIYWNGVEWVNALGYPVSSFAGVETIGRVGTVTVTTV